LVYTSSLEERTSNAIVCRNQEGIRVTVNKKEPPKVHYYDQDFVDTYDKSWAWIKDYWVKGGPSTPFQKPFFMDPTSARINSFDAALSTFFLVNSNGVYNPLSAIDNFYAKQEESGAIRGEYDLETGEAYLPADNPDGILPPLFAWAEFNIYHKIGLKRRIKEIVPILEKQFAWLELTLKKENGLYEVPLAATTMLNSPRGNMVYPIDFNSQMAVNALYLSALGDILNDKELSFRYKKHYYGLKTRINSLMWDSETSFYYDLDGQGNRTSVQTIGTFWTLLAEIPNEERANLLISHLKNEKTFGLPNPFPSLSASDPNFDRKGGGWRGGVFPAHTFAVVKGLEKYGKFELAREASIKHLYYVLDTLHPDGKEKGALWEAYQPLQEGPCLWPENPDFPKMNFLAASALSTITLMIENVVGLFISLPRKTVDWIVPVLELMGIENLSLKRNFITILSNKSGRGWEIRLESEKLYYFTIDILHKKKKTLPIPSGKCSMLIDKL